MFKICGRQEIIDNEEYDAVFCFGAGRWSKFLGQVFKDTVMLNRVIGFVDNDKSKEGKRISIAGFEYPVKSAAIFKKYRDRKIAIIITCKSFMEVLEQLKKDENLRLADFYYIHHFGLADIEAKAMEKEIPDNLRLSEKPLIPKVIHYCWFGGNPIPDKYKAWIESWHKFCPDYEIKEWNESNYDITKNKYMHQAYEQKRWGFVPDYARLDIIYNYGGIYLDTDVEIVSSFDELLYQKGFAGFETEQFVALGLGFGAVPKLPIIKEMMDYYEDKQFVNEDGSLNLIASPRLQTDVLLRHGLQQNGEYQVVDGLTIFPEKMLCGKNERLRRIMLKPYTRSIHHYDGSWMDEEQKKLYDEKELISKESIQIEQTGGEVRAEKDAVGQGIKISVVVIVYNVEAYLKECIESIRNQSYQNLEIILVDDGSTDNSGTLCDHYEQQDARVKVIHKENKGLVSARQAGVKVATGEYVAFVDGDDWIEPRMYEELCNYVKIYGVDIVLSGIIRNFAEQIKKECNLTANGYFDKKDLELDVYPKMMFSMKEMNHYIDPSLCNKLFKREYITKALMEADTEIFYLGEDAAVTYPCLLQVNSIFVTNRAFYHHRIIPVAEGDTSSYKREYLYERLEKFYIYLKNIFLNSPYSRIMEPQLTAYYMAKLNQVTIRRIGVDFLQFYRNHIQSSITQKQIRYKLPKEQIPENCKLVLYGAGAVGKDYNAQLCANNYNVIAWIDKNVEVLKMQGWPIKGLNELKQCKYDKIIIAAKKEELYENMKDTLLECGVEDNKILWLPPVHP